MSKYINIGCITTVLVLSLISRLTLSDQTTCVDVLSDVDVIAKIAPNKYDVTYGNPSIMRTRMILITERSQFSGPGRIFSHMWIEGNKSEFVESKVNGFSQKVQVIRESMACDKLERPKMEAQAKAEREETLRQRAKATKDNAEWQAQMQNERDKENKMTDAEKEAERLADREEAKAVAQTQADQTDARQKILHKQGDDLHAKMVAWFAMPDDKRQSICLNMFKGSALDCNDSRWVPRGKGLDKVFP